MHCPRCGTAGQTAGTNCNSTTCGFAIPATATQAVAPAAGQAVLAFGPQTIAMPSFVLSVAGQQTAPTSTTTVPQTAPTSTTQVSQVAPASNGRGWLFGTLLTLGILAGVAFIVFLVWALLRDQPNYSPVLEKIHAGVDSSNGKLDAIAPDASEASVHSKLAAAYAKANNELLVPIARRVKQTHDAVKHIGSVGYDDEGNVISAVTIKEAIEAARKAAEAAERRPRVVVRKVSSTVDLSGVETRLSLLKTDVESVKDMLNAPPTLERVSP